MILVAVDIAVLMAVNVVTLKTDIFDRELVDAWKSLHWPSTEVATRIFPGPYPIEGPTPYGALVAYFAAAFAQTALIGLGIGRFLDVFRSRRADAL